MKNLKFALLLGALLCLANLGYGQTLGSGGGLTINPQMLSLVDVDIPPVTFGINNSQLCDVGFTFQITASGAMMPPTYVDNVVFRAYGHNNGMYIAQEDYAPTIIWDMSNVQVGTPIPVNEQVMIDLMLHNQIRVNCTVTHNGIEYSDGCDTFIDEGR